MKSNFTKLITVFLFLSLSEVKAQNIGINGTGANPNASALLDIDDAGSNNKGLLIPRIPLTSINAAAPVTSPATSLLVYNTASASTGTNAVSPGYYYWDGTKWVRFSYNASGTSANDWNLLGNAGTNPTTNFLGTTDAQDLVFRTNSIEKMRILVNGFVGIGTPTPRNILDVVRSVRMQGSSATYTNANHMLIHSPDTINKDNVALSLVKAAVDSIGARIDLNGYSNPTTYAGEIEFYTRKLGVGEILQHRMHIDNGGNVGIGTGLTVPPRKLTVYSSGVTQGAIRNIVDAGFSGIEAMSFHTGGNHPYFMGLMAGGTNTAPTYPLVGQTLSSYIGRDAIDGLVAANYGGASIYMITTENFSASNKGTMMLFSTTSNSTNILGERMRIDHNGNVGIGTTSPTEKLHVVNSSIRLDGNTNTIANSSIIKFGLNNSTDIGWIGDGSTGDNNMYLYSYNTDVRIGTGAIATQSNSIYLNQLGNVGVGTTTPNYKLDVTAATNPAILVGTGGFGTGGALHLGNPQHGIIRGSGSATLGFTPTPNEVTLYTTSANLYLATGPVSATPKITIDPVGNIGIGTTAPTQKLHVKEGYILLDNTTVPESALILSNNNTGINSNASIQFRNQAGNVWTNYMGGPTGYAGVDPNALEWWEYPFSQMSNSGTCCLTRFKIQPNNTGVGYATVVIDGSGQMYGNGWAQPSDRTLKKNIKPLTNALDKISKLGGYSYNFTKESNLDDGKVHIGVIAQEVEAVLPEAVSQFPNASYKAINYDALIPLQIEAIKELREENIKQQNLISDLLKRIEALEKK